MAPGPGVHQDPSISSSRWERSLNVGTSWARSSGPGRLFAEARTVAGQFANKSDPYLALFAARLSRVHLPGALRIAEGIADKERAEEVLANIAGRIAADNPAAAERVLDRIANPVVRVGRHLARLPEDGRG